MTDNRFLAHFILLSVASGLTVGLGKIVTTLYALSLGASPFQIGIVSAMESVGMMLVTVPAGFIIARYGMRSVYCLSSLGPLVAYIAMPLSASWMALAGGRFLIGLCIPFRIVSMNSAFLERLPSLGAAKGGWYRATQQAGMAIIGPAAAAILTQQFSVTTSFLMVAALFGVMAAFSLSVMPSRTIDSGPSTGFLAQLRTLLADPQISETCLIEILSSATTSLFSTFIILLAIALPPLTGQDGIRVMLFQGVTTVVMLLGGGAFVARYAVPGIYRTGLALGAGAMLTFGLATGFGGLAFGAVLLSAGAAVVHLANVRILAGLPGGKSKVTGLYTLASMTGSSAGAISAGLLSKLVSLQTVFLLWLPVLAAGTLIIIAIRQRGRTSSPLIAEVR